MKKNYKNQKGINLISLSIAVIVILVIVGTVLYNVKTNIGVQRLKAMQADIENLRGKVSNYYLQYGALPLLNVYVEGVKQDTYISKDSIVISDAVNNASNNQLDTGDYYVIDLKAMDNITLTYGEDYETLKNETASNIQSLKNGTLTDVYIINSVSHNIFYVAGITYDGKTYYTQYQDEEKDKIGESNFDIDLESRVEKDSKGNLIYRVEKGERAPANRNAIYIDEDENKALIPAGFTVSGEQGESTIENGLVVRDDNQNEWVWIPVSSEDISKMYTEDKTGWTMSGTNIVTNYKTINTTLGSKTFERLNPGEKNLQDTYKEPDLLDNIDTVLDLQLMAGFKDISSMATELRDDYKNMIDSIKKNKGFYVGRYEIGGSIEQPVEKKNEEVLYNQNWYSLYKLCKKFSGEKVESRMIWGCQWDQVCRFINEFGKKVDLDDSTTYGNFNNSSGDANIAGKGVRKTTGFSDYWRVNNIYDFAGNCWEYTQEAYNYNGECRARRGRSI